MHFCIHDNQPNKMTPFPHNYVKNLPLERKLSYVIGKFSHFFNNNIIKALSCDLDLGQGHPGTSYG